MKVGAPPPSADSSRVQTSRFPSLTTQILAALVLGAVVGTVWPHAGVASKPLADAFLRLIKMIVAPLVFSTLVAGVAGAGDIKAMGRIGLKAIVYFEVATTIALLIGLGLVNAFKPGAGVAIPLAGDTSTVAAIAGSLALPIYSELTALQQETVVAAIGEFVQRRVGV